MSNAHRYAVGLCVATLAAFAVVAAFLFAARTRTAVSSAPSGSTHITA